MGGPGQGCREQPFPPVEVGRGIAPNLVGAHELVKHILRTTTEAPPAPPGAASRADPSLPPSVPPKLMVKASGTLSGETSRATGIPPHTRMVRT